MNHRALTYQELQAAILARMSATRARLLAGNAVNAAGSSLTKKSSSTVGLLKALVNAPHVVLLLALCIGGLMFVPRRNKGPKTKS